MDEWKKAFDPRKIIESYYGDLGGVFGLPFGAFGDFVPFKPESYFKLTDSYNANTYFDAKTIIRQATR